MRRKIMGALTIAVATLALAPPAEAQRGGRGGGMSRGGGGGFGGGMSPQGGSFGGGRSSGSMGPYGGSGSHSWSSQSGTTANGGQYRSGSGSGSYNTQRGGTVHYGAAGAGGTGAGGSSAGKGVYGVSGTTAGGKDYASYGKVGGAIGAQGNSATTRSNVYGASGANGAVAGGSRYGAAIGQNGAVAGGSRYGAAYGQGGSAAAGAWGYGTARSYGTSFVPSSAIAAQGTAVRVAYSGANYGSPAFYGGQKGAWAAGGAAIAATTAPATWGAIASTTGYPAQPVYNDYGGNVVVQPDAVYVNGDPAGTPQQYAQQAGQIAASGASEPDPASAWQHLGVYALAHLDQEEPPTDLFQLAINRQGLMRGNYHNTQTNTTEPLSGSVDPRSLRAAWSIAGQKAPVFEAGIANLSNDQTTMLIHDASGRSSQATLVRLPPQADDTAPGPAGQPARP